MRSRKEIWILGMALFAMFFGAGNLMFPPSIGYNTGSEWLLSALGFLLTGVGLPLLGVLAFTRCGNLESFASKVSPLFNTIYCTLLILVIGPLFAIPRTASTTFEMGVLPIFPEISPIVSSIVFFGISLLLVIKETKITDIIGKFLTPLILIIIAIIAFIGISNYTTITTPTKVLTSNFAYGIVNGYQTMDALASVLFGVIIVSGLSAKGITELSVQRKYLFGASIIAAILLGVIYFVLTLLGAQVSDVPSTILDGTTKISLYISEQTLGATGKVAFGICVSLACLTTAIGLIALASDWLSKISPIPYKAWVIINSIFSAIIAVNGVDQIIKLSIPILMILYPLTIVLIFLNIFGVKNRIFFIVGSCSALLFSILDVLKLYISLPILDQIFSYLPLASEGFAWLIPTIIITGISGIIIKKHT